MGQGTVNVLFRRESTAGSTFASESSFTMTENNDSTSKLGYSLSMSTDENFVVSGAPYTNTIGSDGSTRFSDAGLIKTYLWEPYTFKYGILNTITPPTDEAKQEAKEKGRASIMKSVEDFAPWGFETAAFPRTPIRSGKAR